MKKLLTILIGICLLASFTACTLEKEDEIPVTPTDVVEQKFEEIAKEANDAGSMWELICRLFPDYVIYKDSVGNFTHSKVNTELKLNTYDWSSLAGTRRGIDVSHYQGKIDWEKVAASGVEFCFVRSGYRGYSTGKIVEDKRYEINMTEAGANGINLGVYFVTKAISEEEAVEEANWVIEHVKPYDVSYPIVIDIEPTSNFSDRTSVLSAADRTKYVLAFCNTIKDAGYTPMIYGGVGTFMSYLDFEQLEGVEKWFAQYFNQPYLRYEFGIWQSSSTGSIPGIKGDVDIDYSIKDYSEL